MRKIVTSSERHEARYKRRRQKRLAKCQEKRIQCSFEHMFSYNDWIDATVACKRNVYYKSAVQLYMDHPLIHMYEKVQEIKKGKIPFRINTCRIIIRERGKERKIEPIMFEKRIGEHVFCDNIYLPYFRDLMIYDNGASIKGRGTNFARKRMLRHLEKALREYGVEFHAWQFDFKSFFESIKYYICEQILRNHFKDERTIDFSIDSITEYTKGNIEINLKVNPEIAEQLQQKLESGNGEGICLGSQNSQITALIVPNELDHFIKDICRMKYYCRYMDDGIVLHNDKKYLKELWNKCQVICKKLGLSFNTKKTKIVKVSRGFVFLKTKYQVTKDGKILRRPHRSGIVRNRRRLKRFAHLVEIGKMSLDDVYNSFQSYYNHTKKIGKSFKTRKQMIKQYIKLFGGYKLDKLLGKRYKGGNLNVVLQSN